MKADATTEAAVKAALDKMAEAYAMRDSALLRAAFAPDPDVVMYGTGADEKRGEKWLIVQAHFSFPASGQAQGEAFPK